MLNEILFEDKPVWKKHNEDWFLVYNGIICNINEDKFSTLLLLAGYQWVINDDVKAEGNISSFVFGWVYYGQDIVWPDSKYLFIIGMSKF